jgi:hypothetical protein
VTGDEELPQLVALCSAEAQGFGDAARVRASDSNWFNCGRIVDGSKFVGCRSLSQRALLRS